MNLSLGTDYTKTQGVLSAKAGDYDSLKWKRSTKQPALSTIVLNDENKNVPLISQLYQAVKATPNFAFKVDRTTYKVSTFDGKEFLQRWQPVK